MRSLLSVDDLGDSDLEAICDRAAAFATGATPSSARRLVGLAFLETSLRTRLGFAAAATRLGWGWVDVFEQRAGVSSSRESWADTLRTVAGYCDVVVARPGRSLGEIDAGLVEGAGSVLVNGGDSGPASHHPSQALIDFFAIERLSGPLVSRRLAIVGDLRMRAARSLLRLLSRRPPAEIMIVSDADHRAHLDLPANLRERTRYLSWRELTEVDVVYLVGIPHESIPLARRERLLATRRNVAQLPTQAIFLSPMPIIDEMDAHVRASPQNRMYEQSDLGLLVRMALLEHLCETGRSE